MLKCQFQDANPSRTVYDDNQKQGHTSGKPENDSIEI